MSERSIVRREIQGRDGRVFRLEFDVRPGFVSAVHQFFALAVDTAKFDLSRGCGYLRSSQSGFLDLSLEHVPDSLLLIDAVIGIMPDRVSLECKSFCFHELGLWNYAGWAGRRFFEPEEI
jgi:hypothetical protein